MTHLAFRLTSRRLATALLPIALAMGCAEGEESSMSMETSSSSSSSSGSDGGGGAGGLGGAGGEATTSSSSSSSSSSGGGAGGAGGQGGAGGAGGQGGAGGAGGMNWMPPVGTADYPAESEPNNLKPSANDLAPATLGFTASLHPLGDIDVFAVTVQNPNSSLKIAVSDGMGGCPPFANVLTRVFGPSGLLASKSGNCPKLSPPALPGLGQLDPGTYFVQVESANLKEVPFYVVELSVISAGCGDGTVQPGSGEQCDDSNTVSGDGCSDTCQVETACGDGKLFVIVGEQCDDGNTADGDGCSSSCVIEGKNFTMEAEPNDAATPNPVDGFDGVVASIQPLGDQDFYTFNVVVPGSSARIEVTNAKGGCPNGFDTKIYLYDPANAEVAADDDDGANSCSKIIPETDPGAQNLGVGTYTIKVEEFGNNATTPFYVLEVKVTPPGCGDLLLSVGEQCDDGNTASGDGCTSTCQLEAACGDGKAHAVLGEQCDDGNTASGDGCSSSCQLEGKSLVNEVEPNDPASMSPTSLAGYQGAVGAISPPGDKDVYSFAVTAPGSTAVIKVTNGFGGCPAGFDSILTLKDPNGAVLVTDDNDGPDSCSLITPALDPAAQSLPIGTYTVTVEENGNNALQPYYVLEVIVAAPGCGDALMQAGETCDDGNAADGDGCDSSCHLELNLRQEAEPNGVGDPATSLAGYEGAIGAIGAIGDVDTYSFAVTVPGSSVTIEVTDGLGGCPLGFDSELHLLDANGSELAVDDDEGVDLCSALVPVSDAAATNLAVGTYKVQVNEHGNNKAQGFYVVLVRVMPPGCGDGLRTGLEQCDDGNLVPGDGCDASCVSEAPWEIEPNNSSMTATSPWAGTDIWRGSIKPVGDVDYYVFNFPGGGATLTLEVSDVGNPQECGFDSMIHLLDANGVELAKDDDDGVNNCSKLSSSLDPALANLPLGTYFVWMQRYSNSQEIAGYDLTLTIQ